MDLGIYMDDTGGAGIIPGTTGAADPYSAHPTAGETGYAAGTGTGQHGIAPHGVTGGAMDAVNSVWDWLNQPFKAPMSPVGIALIVGAVIIAIILWNFVLYHVRIAAETL